MLQRLAPDYFRHYLQCDIARTELAHERADFVVEGCCCGIAHAFPYEGRSPMERLNIFVERLHKMNWSDRLSARCAEEGTRFQFRHEIVRLIAAHGREVVYDGQYLVVPWCR